MANRRSAESFPVAPEDSASGDFELTPAVEAALDTLAWAGRTDSSARNELYARLSLKIARFLAPYAGQETAVGDFDDLRQEAFLVFAGLVADWSGAGSFARYFLGFFPWRLRHVIERHERRRRHEQDTVMLIQRMAATSVALGGEVDPAVAFGPLSPAEERLLQLWLLEDRTVEEAARLCGWSRRTAYRRWRALLARLARQGGVREAPGRRAS